VKTFDENTAAAYVLHIRHHGRPKGVLYRIVPTFSTMMANTGDPSVRMLRIQCSGGSPVPCQQLGHRLLGAVDGHQNCAPGAKLDGASYSSSGCEKVTHTAGVPTVWLMLLIISPPTS